MNNKIIKIEKKLGTELQALVFTLLLMHDQIHDFCEKAERNKFDNLDSLCVLIVKKYLQFLEEHMNIISKQQLYEKLIKYSQSQTLIEQINIYYNIKSINKNKINNSNVSKLRTNNKKYAHRLSLVISIPWEYQNIVRLNINNKSKLPCISNHSSLTHFFENKSVNLYIDSDQKKFRLAPLFDYVCSSLNKENNVMNNNKEFSNVTFNESPMNIYDQANDGSIKSFFSDLRDVYGFSKMINSKHVYSIEDNQYHFTIKYQNTIILEYIIRIKEKAKASTKTIRENIQDMLLYKKQNNSLVLRSKNVIDKNLKRLHNSIRKTLIKENVEFLNEGTFLNRISFIDNIFEVFQKRNNVELVLSTIRNIVNESIALNLNVDNFTALLYHVNEDLNKVQDSFPYIIDCKMLNILGEYYYDKNAIRNNMTSQRKQNSSFSEISLRNFNSNYNQNRINNYKKNYKYTRPSVSNITTLLKNQKNISFEFLFLKTVCDLSQILYCFRNNISNNKSTINVFGTMDEVCAYIGGLFGKVLFEKEDPENRFFNNLRYIQPLEPVDYSNKKYNYEQAKKKLQEQAEQSENVSLAQLIRIRRRREPLKLDNYNRGNITRGKRIKT